MKPNIIFIFSDQQRADTVGAYGQKLDVTPNIDKLAEEGTLFENAFTCQPVCGPARACLQTGKYATELNCHRNALLLPLDADTIANKLNRNGYETSYVGKWHLASHSPSNDEPEVHYETVAIPKKYRGGYEDYWMASDVLEFTSHGYDGCVFDKDMNTVEFKGFRADCITDLALDYLDIEKEKPFFMMVSYIEPHHQNDRDTYEGPIGSKEKFKDYEVPKDLEGKDGDWKENYPDYLGCCHSIDTNVGRIVEKLKEKKLLENTIIIYSSDHGSHFKTRNSEYKRSCHESSIKVPLIVWGKEFNKSKNVKDLVSIISIPNTILSNADIDTSDLQGEDLSLYMNSDYKGDNEVFLQISESIVGRCIRTPKWKYSIKGLNVDPWADSYAEEYVDDFLYDLENDPYEQNNLINKEEYAKIKENLRDKLIKKMIIANEDVPIIKNCNS